MSAPARFALALVIVATLPLYGGRDPHLSLVPWKVLARGESVSAPLVVFWIPASAEEVRRSKLLESSDLTLFSSRCVAMRIVRLDDRPRLAALNAGDALPLVVIVEPGAGEVRRVEAQHGHIALHAVESAVGEEIARIEKRADGMLDTGRLRLEEGKESAARLLYRKVKEQRCICPRQAREAERVLRRLDR
jgi:hypothetical protein